MKPRLVVIALLVGALNALVFLAFEWVVKHGTDYIWNDLANSDSVRWRVVPLAIAGSLVLSIVVRWLGQPRLVPVQTDLLGGLDEAESATVRTIAVTLAIGATSLLAGASLGPEASLVAAALGLGMLFKAGGRLMVLASVGALLVAFCGSLLPIALPVLMLYQKEKRLVLAHVLVPIVTGVAAFATLHLVAGEADGFGSIPASTHYDAGDVALAFLLGACGVPVAVALRAANARFAAFTHALAAHRPGVLTATLFGTVLGLLYLIGGQSVQFTGSEGSELLLQNHAQEGALALAGLAAIKLLATGWSLACGYRGGLVFPSIYVGVAVSLMLGSLGGPGATIGAVAGILIALTTPAAGVVMVLALLPVKLTGLGLVGAAGAIAGKRVLTRAT